MGLQLSVEGPLFAPYEAVEERMKGRRVIVVACVAELVEDDKLAEVLGQQHNEERDADVVAAATRPPACVCRRDTHLAIGEVVHLGKAGNGSRNIFAGLATQPLDIGRRSGGVVGNALSEALACGSDPLGLALGKGDGAPARREERIAEAQSAIGAHNKTNRACTQRTHTLYST